MIPRPRIPVPVGGDCLAELDASANPMRPPVAFLVPWGDAGPRLELRALTARPELWIATTGPQTWAGFVAYVSEDGDDFTAVPGAGHRSTCGELLGRLPGGHAPGGQDRSSCVAVGLYERGTLTAVPEAAAFRGRTLAYVGDGRNGYELVAYSWAELKGRDPDGTHVYELGRLIRRGLYGTPVLEHPAGSRFVELGVGRVFRVPLAERLIGGTLWIRVVACNGSGQGEEDPADGDGEGDTIALELEPRFARWGG